MAVHQTLAKLESISGKGAEQVGIGAWARWRRRRTTDGQLGKQRHGQQAPHVGIDLADKRMWVEIRDEEKRGMGITSVSLEIQTKQTLTTMSSGTLTLFNHHPLVILPQYIDSVDTLIYLVYILLALHADATRRGTFYGRANRQADHHGMRLGVVRREQSDLCGCQKPSKLVMSRL